MNLFLKVLSCRAKNRRNSIEVNLDLHVTIFRKRVWMFAKNPYLCFREEGGNILFL